MAALVGAFIYLSDRLTQPNNDGSQAAPPAHPAPQAVAGQGKTVALAALPDYEVYGDPASSPEKITVGWQYDSVNQSHPAELQTALSAVQAIAKQNSACSVVIADIDVPLSERNSAARAVDALGIAVNGQAVPGLTNNPGEGSTTVSKIIQILPRSLRLGH